MLMCELCWNSDVELDFSYIAGVVTTQRHSVDDAQRRECPSGDRPERPHLVLARLRSPMGWGARYGYEWPLLVAQSQRGQFPLGLHLELHFGERVLGKSNYRYDGFAVRTVCVSKK